MSDIIKGLNDQVEEFRTRTFNKTYLFLEYMYFMRKSEGCKVRNMAVLVVCSIDLDGKRDILALEPMHEESEVAHSRFFENIKSRSKKDVWLFVFDEHLWDVVANYKVHYEKYFSLYSQAERNKSMTQINMVVARL